MAGPQSELLTLWQQFRRLSIAMLALATAMLPFAANRAAAQPFDAGVDYAILVDYATGSVLYQRNADAPMPPASMAKLMTMLLVFEALRDGRLTLDTEFVISENAWRKGGAPSRTSTMFAELGSHVAIRDLMRGVIVQSGNDAAIAIAEGMAGSEDDFVVLMNEEAARLGLTGTVFTNPTGLPDPDQHVTARDLATLAATIIREFPEYYAIYSERAFTWNDITQSNRNPLLGMGIGADGMTTGYTDESGYGLVASAVRNGRRLVAVINGAASDAERSSEAEALINWGFDAFTSATLFAPGDVVAEAKVFGGAVGTVGLRVDAPLDVLVPNEAADRITAEIVYQGPLRAPVTEGDFVGTLRILLDGEELTTAPVSAAASVGEGTMPQRARDALIDIFFGWQ
jgi:D-alanyl-D-alanine carboxypeptidase (penicillin-binding protein 5/6)